MRSTHGPLAVTGLGLATVKVTFARALIWPEDGTMMSPTVRSGRSMSDTFTRAVALLKPPAVAVITTGCTPSFNPSGTPLIVKLVELCPLGIVTVEVAGTASPGSPLERVTTSGPAGPVLRVTVPLMLPLSKTTSPASSSVNDGPSLSYTLKVAMAWPLVIGVPFTPRTRANTSVARGPLAS